MRFFAEHGMYQEEMKVGNEFEVDISLQTKAPKKVITSIEQTINYVEVYRILQEIFSVRKQLLETCAMEIGNRLEEKFPAIENISIVLKKLSPPITNFSGAVAVRYNKSVRQK